MRRDEKQGDQPSDCVAGVGGPSFGGDCSLWCVEGWFGESQ